MSRKVTLTGQDEGGQPLFAFSVSARLVAHPALFLLAWAIAAITAIASVVMLFPAR
ncbi:hypothetical protein [Streptomyces rhizosphaericola]|uniref:hypothetical protein n=1 Tax=Streptomyces rhizosphaericola TaxID=2564098 RepID=UPI001441988E|nr:hypothetical protein [Streptomyces rhizosphaericola]